MSDDDLISDKKTLAFRNIIIIAFFTANYARTRIVATVFSWLA